MRLEPSIKQSCLCCESGTLRLTACQGDRRKGLPGSWQLFECGTCNVLMILPTPTAAQLSEYYAEYADESGMRFTVGRGTQHPFIGKLVHWLAGEVDPRDFVHIPTGAHVLDYGCGQAGCLWDFHARGVRISGAEIAAPIVEACRKHGLDVRQVNNPDRIPFEDGIFDVVYLMQVFEHLRNPHAFMGELARVTKPNAVIYMAVPNSRSFWRRVFGRNWVSGWFTPFHLFHYDRESLSNLARRHGFETLDSWSRTPAAWFRLNIKAWLLPHENRLDRIMSLIDATPLRQLLMLVLRFLEFFIRERDCLVVKLVKRRA